MATTIKTPTRIVKLTLIDRKSGLDWSRDFVGNQSDRNLRRDPDGQVDYLADDATADWWEMACADEQAQEDSEVA